MAKAPGVFRKTWTLFVVSDRCQKDVAKCKSYHASRNRFLARATYFSVSEGRSYSNSSRLHKSSVHSVMVSGAGWHSKPHTRSP